MAYFTLARKVDPTYRTNLMILIMTITLLIAKGLLTNDWGGSLVYSAGFFLTWALAREIDPLHEPSAFVAALVYLLMTTGTLEINLGLVFWTVLLLRGITKISGKTITLLDLLSLTGLGIYVMLGQENGIYGLILTGAMVLGYIRFSKSGIFQIFIMVGVIVSIWGITKYSIPVSEAALEMDSFRWMLLLLGLAFGTFYGTRFRKDRDIQDDLGGLVESKYVLLSYIFFLGIYTLLIMVTDPAGGTVSLFLAVILGVSLYRIWMMISNREDRGTEGDRGTE